MKLNPQCLIEKDPKLMAITNEGYLIPCCYCDAPTTMNDPEFKKLLRVSNISFYDDLEDIFHNKEWSDFYENLKQHKGPPSCISTCGVKEDGTKTRVSNDYDTSSGNIKNKRIM